jgi:hypothetical protein
MFVCRLDSLNVLSLLALRAFSHVELHGLPFLQAAKAAILNSGEMHEDILPSLTADEGELSEVEAVIAFIGAVTCTVNWKQNSPKGGESGRRRSKKTCVLWCDIRLKRSVNT